MVAKTYKRKKGFYERFIKRPMDFLLSLFAIIILSPLFILVAILVRLKLGNPILFKQERIGLSEKKFNIYKFRTMTNKCDENGELLPDEQRLTKFGIFLRSTSLDELPELFNILFGHMSIVGPRPLLVRYLPYYTNEERMRHDVRPGLTGLAQISGRNYITWDEKFKKDLEYVMNISFLTDLKIIFSTFIKVFKRENIETASVIEHDGIQYVPLDVERSKERKTE